MININNEIDLIKFLEIYVREIIDRNYITC